MCAAAKGEYRMMPRPAISRSMTARIPFTPPAAVERSVGRSSSPRHRADDEKRFGAGDDGIGQPRVGRLVREIVLAREEAHERPPLERDAIPHRPPQRRIRGLERAETAGQGWPAIDVDSHLVADACERPQMRRQDDADHRSVCTSTDRTGGRSRTIGIQLSPAFFDAYT